MTTSKRVIAWDLYGTLLSTESIAKQLESFYGADNAPTIAAAWRKYQLEYTWRLNSMGRYQPFSTVTREALRHAVLEAGMEIKLENVDSLMRSYDSLNVFDDVEAGLRAVSEYVASSKSDTQSVVFSNGTHDMVATSMRESKGLQESAFGKIVTVEPVKAFKPAMAVYEHLAKEVGVGKDGMRDLWLVTANPFDVVGAKVAGMSAIWVDRGRNGWVDSLELSSQFRPDAILHTLEDIPSAFTSEG